MTSAKKAQPKRAFLSRPCDGGASGKRFHSGRAELAALLSEPIGPFRAVLFLRG